MTKNKKNFFSILIILLIMIGSNYLVRYTSVASFSVFNTTNLFTYFGVLIGFALTIYTFGLSMVSDIKSKIDKNQKFDEENKVFIYNRLENGFKQIKEDIWLIFYSVLLIIIFAIAKEIPNPFNLEVECWKIPETINLGLFITTTISMWDIMKTLFNLSEINFELNRN